MNSNVNKPEFPDKHDASERGIVLYLLLIALLYAITIFGIYTYKFL